jgi:hypothetical protein
MIDKNLIDRTMRDNQQFPYNLQNSDLWKSIQQALNCTTEESIEMAKVHCNSLSSYALFRARGWIMFPYQYWVEKLVEVGGLSNRGWLSIDMRDIAKLFGFQDEFNELKYFYNYSRVMNAEGIDPEKGYKIKVYSNSNLNNEPGKGDHFMPAYVHMGKLYLSDSGRRGTRVEAASVIPPEKFQWALEV